MRDRHVPGRLGYAFAVALTAILAIAACTGGGSGATTAPLGDDTMTAPAATTY